ncbi:MAG: ATP-binding protein [bacterium]|nr:ATP-binding protein [bacterium]
MKIAFIGTHGVGKTTLCFELAACLKRLDVSVDVVKEVARHCPLPINRDTTSGAQEWILHTQIAWEIATAASYQAVVCDRSVLDNYAYMVHAVGRRPDLEPLLRHWLSTYKLLVRVPVLGAPAFDGTRDTSAGFQMGIDALIRELLAEFRQPCLELDPDHRDGWIGQVLEAVGLPRHSPQLDLFNGLGRHG